MKRSPFPRLLLAPAACSFAVALAFSGCDRESGRSGGAEPSPDVSVADRGSPPLARRETAPRERRERAGNFRQASERDSGKLELRLDSMQAPVRIEQPDGSVARSNTSFRVQLNGQSYRLENGRLVLDGERAQVRRVAPRMNMEPFDAWLPIFQGVDRGKVHCETPRLMDGWAMRVDLRAEGISFLTTPPSGPNEAGEALGLKTSSFLRKHHCQVVVNANYFSPMWQDENRPYDVKGLQISRGRMVSKHRVSNPALLISKDNRARIADGSIDDLDAVYTAVAGNSWCLQEGQPVQGYDVHPRVAAGLSKDARYLYLLAIDGRQGGHSIGATVGELGAWLKKLGAWNGINLDGGGTASMAMEDENGRAVVINRPIHNGRPGNERPSPSHLGVYAKRLR